MYDVIIIGAGPGGIFSAYELIFRYWFLGFGMPGKYSALNR